MTFKDAQINLDLWCDDTCVCDHYKYIHVLCVRLQCESTPG